MNKTIKDALAKGKALRSELDKKAEEEARIAEEQKRVAAAKAEAELRAEAERALSYVPESLARAVAERKPSFSIYSRESDHKDRFTAVCKILEPKLKKMGLQYKYETTSGWVQLTYDPDTGYDAIYYHLEVLVPEEGL
jgi:hypothetical protein